MQKNIRVFLPVPLLLHASRHPASRIPASGFTAVIGKALSQVASKEHEEYSIVILLASKFPAAPPAPAAPEPLHPLAPRKLVPVYNPGALGGF